MRILYDHQLFSRQRAGGASRYFYELIRAISAHPEVQAELLMGINRSIYPFQALASANLRVTAFDGPALPGMWLYLANEALSNALVPFRGTWDVYHSTLYRRMPLVRTRRLVATHHDCTQERYPEEFRHVEQVIRAKRELYDRADAIICVSEYCRHELLQFYNVDPSKTRVIYHGLSRLPRSADAAAELRRHVKRQYLLYVGSRASYKNFTGLVTAVRQSGIHQQFDLLVLGGGVLTSAEEQLIAQLELTSSVIIVPIVSDELLAEAYAGARLFVYPSFSEGFGLPPLEAMAAECPVLASNTSCIPEICQDGPFYFDPHSSDSFRQALLTAVNDDAARQVAIVRGTRVAAQYQWQRCGDETLRLYRDC